ncbi:DUF898 domain-containing protein [Halosquirtibacter xylanolyticus]|uniref:hypothetical protein n=1 Tax=Halosquirtibacter xylanolyticus TaxID=3374599 RepID=UPI00374861B1|nr:DUF898 domain-containing protein [Prolixibacteraceae bacterium]
MKRFLSSQVDIQNSFKYFVIFIIAFVVAISSIMFINNSTSKNSVGAALGMIASLLLLIGFISIFICSYIWKVDTIKGVRINNEPFKFIGSFSSYLAITLGYGFTVILSNGILYPLLQKKILSFFIDNTYLNNKKLTFKGKTRVLLGYHVGLGLITLILSIFLGIALGRLINGDTREHNYT